MRPHSYRRITLQSAVALVALTTGAHAQSRTSTLPSGKVFDFTPYVGYMVFGDTLVVAEDGCVGLSQTEKKLFFKEV